MQLVQCSIRIPNISRLQLNKLMFCLSQNDLTASSLMWSLRMSAEPVVLNSEVPYSLHVTVPSLHWKKKRVLSVPSKLESPSGSRSHSLVVSPLSSVNRFALCQTEFIIFGFIMWHFLKNVFFFAYRSKWIIEKEPSSNWTLYTLLTTSWFYYKCKRMTKAGVTPIEAAFVPSCQQVAHTQIPYLCKLPSDMLTQRVTNHQGKNFLSVMIILT